MGPDRPPPKLATLLDDEDDEVDTAEGFTEASGDGCCGALETLRNSI